MLIILRSSSIDVNLLVASIVYFYMLCFSYHFFINSFTRRCLLKYSSLFLFHVLHQFNFNILQILQNSVKHLQNRLSVCVSYGLSVWHMCMRHIFNFMYFFCYNLFNMICLSELNKVGILQVFIRNNINKFILYLYSHSISLSGIYYICRYFELASMLREKYIKYNSIFTFPIKNSVITLLKSPHIDKKARDQFAHTSYKSIAKIVKVPMYFPLFTSKYIQHASNFSFKVISMVHYIYTY